MLLRHEGESSSLAASTGRPDARFGQWATHLHTPPASPQAQASYTIGMVKLSRFVTIGIKP
jgi:hypothetical protein